MPYPPTCAGVGPKVQEGKHANRRGTAGDWSGRPLTGQLAVFAIRGTDAPLTGQRRALRQIHCIGLPFRNRMCSANAPMRVLDAFFLNGIRE